MSALAKLADLKTALGTIETSADSELLRYLEIASSRAEKLVGLADMGLRRREDIVELPFSDQLQSRFVRLAGRPIESVASVKQLTYPGLDADFTAADALVENQDYIVDRNFGKLERIGSLWYLARRCLRVVYTAGFIDPATDAEEIPETAILPPSDLQHGVIQEAIRLYRLKDAAGSTGSVNVGNAGSANFADPEVHPHLVQACAALKVLL